MADEVVQCMVDAGILPNTMKKYLPEGVPVTKDNLDRVLADFKKDEGRKSKARLQAEAANIEIAVQMERMLRPIEEGGEGMKPVAAVKALLVRDLRDRAGINSVSSLAQGYFSRMAMHLDAAAESLRLTVTGGMRDPELMKDAFRVAGGKKAASNEAAIIGNGIRKALDTGHRLVSQLGGDIGYIPNYLPQTHVAGKIRKAGYPQWRDDVMGLIDRDKMLDWDGNPLDDAAMEDLLEYVFATLTTEGRNKIKPPVKLPESARTNVSAKSHLERVLHFKDVDGALKYNEMYGNADLWGTVTNHLRSLSIDAGVYKMFSPTPDLVYNNWRDWAKTSNRLDDVTEIDHIWRNVVGFGQNGETPILQIANAGRDLLSAGYMGSAVVASIPDVALVSLNASMNGMSVPRMLAMAKSYYDAGDRAFLVRTAGNIEYSLSQLSASMRFEDTMGRGLTHRMADSVYRISGMTGWMNALRHAYLTEFQTMLGGHLNKSLDELPPQVRSFLDTYGLSKRWDDIRKMKTQDFHGNPVADFSSLDDDSLIAELLGAVYTERDAAVLTPDARTRALLNQGKAPGGVAGEGMRALTQFKTFPATIIMHALWRYMFSKRLGSAKNRAAWTFTMLGSMTVLGGVAHQLREMAKGRDPEPMNTQEFLLKAVMQGGAAPGLAELILDQKTRYGKGTLEAMLGPTGGALSTLIFGAGNTIGAGLGIDGAKENALDHLESGTYMLWGSNFWFARAAVQRGLRDTFLDWADPNYAESQLRRERNRRNELDQDAWWGYGDSPRMPDFENALGD